MVNTCGEPNVHLLGKNSYHQTKKAKPKKQRENLGEKQKKHCYIDCRNISCDSHYDAVRMQFPQRN